MVHAVIQSVPNTMTNDNTSRDTRLNLRLTEEEREILEEEAAREHLNLSSWVRSVVMKVATQRRIDRQEIHPA